MKNVRSFFAVLFAALLLAGCTANPAVAQAATPDTAPVQAATSAVQPAAEATDGGKIYLCGEEHSNPQQLAKELQLWQLHYQEGMRHLFVELPYFMAEYLNQWMLAGDDAILDQVFADAAGTDAGTDTAKNFYRVIKNTCPETVFHGTDVGHLYETIGQRYLAQTDLAPAQRTLAEENIEQGKTSYANPNTDPVYRENTMTANFIRAYDE